MLSAVVAIDGPLGDAVARSLETASPRWRAERLATTESVIKTRRAALVIVDNLLDPAVAASLRRQYGNALLVIGRDIDKPFAVATLRAKALALAPPPLDDSDIVVVDPPLREALRVVDAAARRTSSVLVTGPTGVGKELFARRIHERSQRRGAFVPINCAALNDGLAESTLFGHARGAFTGAAGMVPGAFAEAGGGTLFLDEIGDLELKIQAKLLRALEDGAVRPLGASQPRAVDVRVVAATNHDLRCQAAAGAFRSDLYFRLATFVVYVPPLCQRPGDLEMLIDRFTARHERRAEVHLSADARSVLRAYEWPGNVRELRNVIERLMSLAPDGALTADQLRWLAPELTAHVDRQRAGSVASRERDAIDEALQHSTGCRARAAAELGIHRTTLWRRLKGRQARAR